MPNKFLFLLKKILYPLTFFICRGNTMEQYSSIVKQFMCLLALVVVAASSPTFAGDGIWINRCNKGYHRVNCESSRHLGDCVEHDGCTQCDGKCNGEPSPSLSRGTLFQWSYGTGFAGGPNLDEPLVTDRPDFTESSVTVGRGVAQLEFGYTYVYNSDGGESVRLNSFGEPLLRYGIFADWLEFRIGIILLEERTTTAVTSNSTAGASDLYLGFKIALTPQTGILPEMALIPQMNVPTGSNAFTSNEVEPGINWVYSWEINDFLSTAGSTQGNRRIDDTGEAYLEIAQSWTVAYSLSARIGAYTEWFAFFPTIGEDTPQAQHFFNGGFTYLINNNIQFDIRAGVGLNDAADDYFLGTGLSIRLSRWHF